MYNSVPGAVDQFKTFTKHTVGYINAEWAERSDPDYETTLM